MAVKHKEVECVERPVSANNADCLAVILRCVEKFRSEPQSIPQGPELVRLVETFVHGLGMLNVPCDSNSITSFIKDVKKIQEFLFTVVNSSNIKESLIHGALWALYTDISDPEVKPKAAMSLILQMVEPIFLPNALNMMLATNPNDASIEQALSTLCGWLIYWNKTPNLGTCVLVFIDSLESRKRYDILINITYNVIDKFLNLLKLPAHRVSIGPIVLKMLSSIQDSPEIFHKIVPHISHTVFHLSQEDTECSRTYLQKIVNLCTILMEHFPRNDSFYEPIITAIKQHPPSSDYRDYLSCNPWLNQVNATRLQSEIGKVGLNNLGNTCYMNSVLQALFMTKLFSNDVLVQTNRLPLMVKLQNLFALLQFSKRNSLSPTDILMLAKPPGFQPGHQHDSSEFLGYLMDSLHEQEQILLPHLKDGKLDLKVTTSSSSQISGSAELSPSTSVQQAFGGRAETTYKCYACQGESTRADNFRDLQLSFPSDFAEDDSVQTLLEFYLKPERLCGENQYHCERCGGLSDAERVFRVLQCPPRLILTLKHFRYDANSQQRIKLLHRVRYSPVIRLENYSYELYAAVIHCGSSVDSGHYYTYAKDKIGWFKFNDSFVKFTSADELFNLNPPETPYILFYSRQDCTEPDPVPRSSLPSSVEAVVVKDNANLEMENLNRKPIVTTHHLPKDDPPPGCGGGGDTLAAGGNRFIC